MTFRLGTVLCLCAATATAGVPLSAGFEAAFYGDNTEFFNPFRSGETLLGTQGRLYLEGRLGPRAALRLGVLADTRYGSDTGFEQTRPLLALALGDETNRLLIGSLDPLPRRDGIGPDATSRHGLLPPLQVETLAFTRPREEGFQWDLDRPAFRNQAWLDWQTLIGPGRSERLDAGTAGRVRLARQWWLGVQAHVVHHGGQTYPVPIGDSFAAALGPRFDALVGRSGRATAELYGLLSIDNPDRSVAGGKTIGHAFYVRLVAERVGWRAHLIVFRGFDFLKTEGDPNYLSRRLDGTPFRNVRDYAELGACREWRPAPGLSIEASARLHRVENHIEYSYRVLATARLGFPLER